MSSIIHNEIEKQTTSLLSSVSDEDMLVAREIAGHVDIHAVLKPPADAKKLRYVCCNRAELPPVLCILPCCWPIFILNLPICPLHVAACFSTQKSLEGTYYIITEGRIYLSVPDYEHPCCGCCLTACKLPTSVKNIYFDIDDVVLRDDPAIGTCSGEFCRPILNPDNVNFLTLQRQGRNAQDIYPFYTSSAQEKDQVIRLVRDIQRRHDEAPTVTNQTIVTAVQSAAQSAPSSKRVFVSSSGDPANFAIFIIEGDDWDSFLNKMRENFGMSTVSSVKLADVNLAVSSCGEINVNDKLVIYSV